VNFAKVLLLQNRKPEGEAVLNELLVKDPADVSTLGTLVQALVQDGRLPQAVAAVEAARTATPSNLNLTAALADLHIRAKEPKKALAVLHQALESGVSPPVLLLAQARAQTADGDISGAKLTYRQILAGTPMALEARRALVELSLNSNDAAGAKEQLREGLKLSPGNLGMMNALIFAEQRISGITGALALADELRRDPANMPAASVVKGDTYMGARRFGDAAAAFSGELKATPSTALALRTASALAAGGGQEQAAQQLRTWLAQHPDDVDATQMLASLDISAGRNQEAEQHLDAVLKRRPNDAIALNNLAWVYQARGDTRARGLAQRAHLLAPSGETSDTLGWIMTKQGAATEALPLLQAASSQRPNDKSVTFHLAMALNAAGKRDEAVRALEPILNDTAEFDDRGAAKTLLDQIKAGK
jgi:putative PEP-CTERM system TPR-repeat lipoprotein